MIQKQAPRTVTTILSGEDIEKFDAIIKVYSGDAEPSVSSVIRSMIRKEYNNIINEK